MSSSRTSPREGFSDGAFSIIITLLVLEIHRPSAVPGRLGHELSAEWSSALLLDRRTDVGSLVACLLLSPPSSGAGEVVFAADVVCLGSTLAGDRNPALHCGGCAGWFVHPLVAVGILVLVVSSRVSVMMAPAMDHPIRALAATFRQGMSLRIK
jgi:hypothetical protein